MNPARAFEYAQVVIATAQKCVDARQSPMLTSIEFAEFLLWSVAHKGMTNPAGKFYKLMAVMPDPASIGLWRKKTAISHAPKPAAMVEAKPREHEIADLERRLSRPDLSATGRRMLEGQLAELRGGA